MFRPATRPIALALSSCSTRTRVPSPGAGFAKLATSPAAYTSGWLVRQNASTTIPFSTRSPACWASSTAGTMPRPATTTSAVNSPPAVVLQRAEVDDRVRLGRQAPGEAAGREQELLEATHRPPVVRGRVPARVDRGYAAPQRQLSARCGGLAPDALLGIAFP